MDYGYENGHYPPSNATRRPDLIHRGSSSNRGQSGEIEQVVTKLLRTTKALLEALTQWSQLRASTTEILEYRETLERQFHLVSQAFEENGVAMSDLAWIPHQLKETVSAAMNEEPSQATLDQHLPKIRDVIVHLLHGLKGKQHSLRERDAQQQQWSSRDSYRSTDSFRSTDSWRREVPQAALNRGMQSPPRGPSYPPGSPPQANARVTASDYDPRSGMPRPSVSSENSPRYAPRPYSPLPQRMPSPSTSTSGDNRPSSTSSTRNPSYYSPTPSNAAPPPPPPPPPMPQQQEPKPRSDFDETDPSTASALAALKRQENLARRSSVRRASMFRANGASSDYHPMKRPGNDLAPPVPSIPSRRSTEGLSRLRTVSESHDVSSEPEAIKEEEAAEASDEKGLTLFLQIGKNVKKVYYTGEISIPALRMLFIERFNYSSGLNDFPNIYIRDTALNVSYELENLEEVSDKTVLSLNVDEAEAAQKQWMDKVTESVEKEMGEIRRLFVEHVDDLKKQVAETQKSVQQQQPPPTPPPPPPVMEEAPVEAPKAPSSSSDTSTQIPTAQLQAQLREIETLRRDMAVLRQLQKEMRAGTNEIVDELKEKSQQLREREEQDKGKQTVRSAARLFIEEGKEKLLASSDMITGRLEDLQDTVDHLKVDVTQRKCRPSEAQMAHCNKEREEVAKEIEEFGAYIVSVKPRWKKTWEQELQTIVKEQQMLKEQEGLLLDMRDDLTALVEVYEQLEKICAYQAKTKPVVREFHVAPAEEGFEGMNSVLKQVQTIDVDHNRRLRALEQSEKMRQREMDNRIDEFEQELSQFVGSKKLKKTGGAEEIERLRAQKDADMRKKLYLERMQKEKQAGQEEDGPDDSA